MVSRKSPRPWWPVSSARYVYAIVRRNTPLPPVGGAAELVLVPWRELAAVTGRVLDDGGRATLQAVVRHETIVEAVRLKGPSLPVRFGTVFGDPAAVAAALADRYEPLAADLDRIGNKVELSLTALWSAPAWRDERTEGVPALSRQEKELSAGARYLYARAAELRRDEAIKERARVVAEKLDRILGARWATLGRCVSLAPMPQVAVRTTYLLDPAKVGDFRTDFEAMRRRVREVRVVLTGPWPPYSFVSQKTPSNEE